jgi:hypothetical protein
MNNQEILDNAPEGASDIDNVNKYWSYQGNGDYYFWDGGKWIENWSPFHTRSLADIKRIAELEGVVKHFCYAVKEMPVCDSYLYSIVEGIEQAKNKGGAE